MMPISLLVSFLVVFLAGFFTVGILLPQGLIRQKRFSSLPFFLSPGIGIGIYSLTYWLWFLFLGKAVGLYFVFEIVILIILAITFYFKRKGGRLNGDKGQLIPMRYRIMFYIIAIHSLLIFILTSIKHPHGGWDAFAIWNLHARFIFGGCHYWDKAIAPLIRWTHPDYPLLIPAFIARSWTYIGERITLVPIAVAFIFTFSTAGLLGSGISILKGKHQGIIAATVLLSTPFIITHGAMQVADIPLSFFFLATVILFNLYDYDIELKDKNGLLVLSGLTTGMAVWTKNEGLLFLFVIIFARIISSFFKGSLSNIHRELYLFLLGLLPVLLIVLHFKFSFPISNELFYGQGVQNIYIRLTDITRYRDIIIAMFKELFYTDRWFIYPILFILCLFLNGSPDKRDKTIMSMSAVLLLLMLLGFFFIYVIFPTTPTSDLAGILEAGLHRRYFQIWPITVFAIFLLLNIFKQETDKDNQITKG